MSSLSHYLYSLLLQNSRLMGCDVAKNTVVLRSGERIKAPHVGVLAAVGKSTVTVYK